MKSSFSLQFLDGISLFSPFADGYSTSAKVASLSAASNYVKLQICARELAMKPLVKRSWKQRQGFFRPLS